MALDQIANAETNLQWRTKINALIDYVESNVVSELPASPDSSIIYYLDTAATVYPKGLYKHDGTGWVCVQQLSAIALANWTTDAVSLTLVPGVLYTVTATGEPASFAVTLETNGEATILKTGAFAIPEPTTGSYLTENGLSAFSDDANDVQFIIQKTGSSIIYSSASLIAIT
jgi:hypothetical protein